MHANDGVLRLDGLSPDELSIATGSFGLREAAVLGSQAFQESLDGLREALVRHGLRGPAGVATSGRHGKQGENGDSGRLVLVGDIGMVSNGAELVAPVPAPILVVGAEIDVVQLKIVLDVRADRLLLMSAVNQQLGVLTRRNSYHLRGCARVQSIGRKPSACRFRYP